LKNFLLLILVVFTFSLTAQTTIPSSTGTKGQLKAIVDLLY